MKHPVRRISATLISLLLIGAMILSSAVIFTACGSPGQRDPLRALTPLTEFILRYYHDLSPEDEITREMCEAITSLELSVMFGDEDPDAFRAQYPHSYLYDDEVKLLFNQMQEKTLINFRINAQNAEPGSYDALLSAYDYWTKIIPANFFNNTLLSSITDAWNHNKAAAYYDLLDISAEPSEEHMAKLMQEFPGIEFCPSYIFDTYAPFFEIVHAQAILNSAGLFDALWLDGTVIDTNAIAAAFPNLEHLELIGLTAAE